MCIELIHYKDDLLGIGVHHIGQIFYLVSQSIAARCSCTLM